MSQVLEAVVSRSELRAVLVLANHSVPPADAADLVDWWAELVGRYATVSGLVKLLPQVMAFGANAKGVAVLAAIRRLP